MVLQANQPMFTTPDAAKFLKLSEHTVRKYVQRGLLTPSRSIGNAYIFLESELRRYKKNKRPRGNPTFSAVN